MAVTRLVEKSYVHCAMAEASIIVEKWFIAYKMYTLVCGAMINIE